MAMLMQFTHGHSMQEVDQLIKVKLANYSKNLRPVLNQSLPVKVVSGLQLVAVKEFDEVTEKITIIAVHVLAWHDANFVWDPKDHGGIEMITINESEIWKPTLILLNTFDKLEQVGGSSFVARILSNGIVAWVPGSILSATCHVDITYYPWDTQECSFRFISWGFISSEVQLDFPEDYCVGTTHYAPSGIWDLVGSKCYSKENDEQTFQLRLKRKPMFIFVNVILPIAFMSSLNLVAFLIPSESGERLSYCITVLLSIAVFLTIVGDNLPKTSNPMSILSYYIVLVLGMSVCITLATIFSLRIYFKDERERVSTFWRRFVRLLRCKMAHESIRCNATEELGIESNHTTASWFSTKGHSRNRGQIQAVEMDSVNGDNFDSVPTRNRNTSIAMPADDDEPELQVRRSAIGDVSWKDVSVTVDKLCFALFLLVYVCCSTWSLVTITRNL